MTTQILTAHRPRKDGAPCHFRRARAARTGVNPFGPFQARGTQLAGSVGPWFKRVAGNANRQHCALQAHSPGSPESLRVAVRAFGEAFVRPSRSGRGTLARLLSGVGWL